MMCYAILCDFACCRFYVYCFVFVSFSKKGIRKVSYVSVCWLVYKRDNF